MKKLHGFVAVLAMILYLWVPTSLGGVMFNDSQIILLWGFTSVFIALFWFINPKDRTNLTILTILLLGMAVATGFACWFDQPMRPSVARLAPILCLLLLCTVTVRTAVNFKVMLFFFELSLWSMFIWGAGILFSVGGVIDFTCNYYSQFYEYIVPYMLGRGKPVISFGIYTFASFFYMLNFMICYRLVKVHGYRRYLFYMLILFTLNVLLFSTTSFCFSLLMLWFLNKTATHTGQKVLLCGVLLAAGAYLSRDYDIFSLYSEHLAKPANGFLSRYGAIVDTFGANLRIIATYPLGIGFCIADDPAVRYTDCGYIVYATMGGIPGMLLIYYALYRFMRNNLSGRDAGVYITIIMLFEFALAAVIYIKFFFFIIFLVYFLRALDSGLEPKALPR